MIRTWEEAQLLLGKLKNDNQRLHMILNDVWEENGITESHRINLFIGKITFTEAGDAFVNDLQNIQREKISRNPYDDYRGLRVYVNKDIDYKYNEDVILTVGLGRRYISSELFIIEKIYTFNQLKIEKPNISEIAKKAVEYRITPQYDNKLSEIIAEQQWPDEFNAFIETKTKLLEDKKKIEGEINDAKDRRNKTEADLQKEKNNYEKIRGEIASLNKQKEELERQVTRNIMIAQFFTPSFDDKTELAKMEEWKSYREFESRIDYRYKESTVIPFLMALSTNQIITLYGPPGKGKTTFVSKMAKALGAKCTIISVQSNWTDKADLLGYYSPIDKTYEATAFIDALICANSEWIAKGSESRLHIICLDEMNLARVEYYFATFLSLLQLSNDKRRINLLPPYIEDELDEVERKQNNKTTDTKHLDIDKLEKDQKYLCRLWKYHSFILPPNVKFVGTINNDDTTNELSPKVKDRSIFIDLSGNERSEDQNLAISDYYPLSFFEVQNAKEEELPEDFSNENNRFITYSKTMLKWLRSSFPEYLDSEQKIKKTIYSYLIITKILPIIRKKDEFNYDEYTEANEVFLDRSNNIPGEYFNILGGY